MRFILLLFLLFPHTLLAQDAYHTFLANELAAEGISISNGNWVFPDTETTTQQLISDSGNFARQTVAVSGQPFSTALRLTVPQRGANPWDYFVNITTQAGMGAGDRALLVLWVRGIDAERASGLVNANIEMNAAPWTKSLSRGLIPSSEWQQWLIPFEASIDHPAGQAQAIFHLGSLAQTIEIGGLALINFGQSYSLDELPATSQDLDYAGRSLTASWRAEAEMRIEQHRKRDLQVRVVDNRGAPVENAVVDVQMQQHHFGFGSAVAVWMMLRQDSDGQMYRSKLSDLNGNGQRFSMSVLENGLKWGAWENPNWPGTQAQTVGVIEDLKVLGMTVRGHNLVWPSWQYMPDEAQQLQNDPPALQQLIETRIANVAGHVGINGEVIDWDVLNEPAHLNEVAQVFAGQPGYPTGEEIYAAWFKQAAQVDPNAKLYINEYSIISSSGLDLSNQERYQEIIELIEAEGGRIDGIGVQGHFSLPLTPPEVVYEVLDQYAGPGKELSITEYDTQGVPEDLAADYMRDILTIAFSHPSMRSFLIWGFWDGAHWKDDAPLFRLDWSLKPSGQAFFDQVFDAWWTDIQGTTDSEGELMVRGFHGTYAVKAELDGALVTENVTLLPAEGVQEVTLMLPTQVGIREDGESVKRFELLPHYPEPVTDKLTVSFNLPRAEQVKLTVFDVLGRAVDVPINMVMQPGPQRRHLDTHRLRNGVYFYQLQAGNWHGRRSFVVQR